MSPLLVVHREWRLLVRESEAVSLPDSNPSKRFHIRNVVSGLLVPDDRRRGPRTFHWLSDAYNWIGQQHRPQDFEVVEA